MKRAAGGGLATGFASTRALALDTVTLPFNNGERPLVEYPQKRPMIGLTSRPPQLETPFSIFNDGPITPNSAFFVRYHLADVPLNIDPDTFTLQVKGKVDKPLTLSLRTPASSRRPRSSPSINAPATAPWATRAGMACR